MGVKTAEEKRLDEAVRGVAAWRRWGPYLAARQWGTAREGESFPHEQARSRAYRWGEDGIAGICDDQQRLCFALSLWNGADHILKERLFGSLPSEGNHGEDAKEYWFHVDATPTHSYLKFLYKYPMAAFPYGWFAEEAARRGTRGREPELIETGVFDGDRYWDVEVEYAKASPEDVLVRITAHNRSPERATLHLLPTLWFRNTWSWEAIAQRPRLEALSALGAGFVTIEAGHATLGNRWLHAECAPVKPELLFTHNETNTGPEHLHAKDAIGERVVRGRARVNPKNTGTKAAAWYRLDIDAGKSAQICLRLSDQAAVDGLFGAKFDGVFTDRIREADEHWKTVAPPGLGDDARALFRQSLAGLLWSQQHVRFESADAEWTHLKANDVVCVPDKWEQPGLSTWDLALLAVPLALVDADLAKRQVLLPLGERYLHPDGRVPVSETAPGETSPPLSAWAAIRVYEIERRRTGHGDRGFLQVCFHKLLLHHGSWANRRDGEPAWVAMLTLGIFAIALELAKSDPAFEDAAVTFLERFARDAATVHPERGALGAESKGSLVPFFAFETIETARLDRLPTLRGRLQGLAKSSTLRFAEEGATHWRVGLLDREKRDALLREVFDEGGLLSPFGIRTLSKRDAAYAPAEPPDSTVNVNRRGAIWLPMNALFVDALRRGGDEDAARAAELSRRLQSVFLRREDGTRPVHGGATTLQRDPRWKDLLLSYESFHADEGAGLGASHCASTALLALLMAHR